MNVTHKVSFSPGLEPVSILIIPPESPMMKPFFIDDSTQTALQALAAPGVPWSDNESRAIAQAWIDERGLGLTVVIPGA
jgi:hypothetical protein